MPRLNRSFNVMVNDQQYEDLERMAQLSGSSKAHVIRDLIESRARMSLSHIPYCVTGRTCLVPHLHVPVPVDTRIPQPEEPGRTPER